MELSLCFRTVLSVPTGRYSEKLQLAKVAVHTETAQVLLSLMDTALLIVSLWEKNIKISSTITLNPSSPQGCVFPIFFTPIGPMGVQRKGRDLGSLLGHSNGLFTPLPSGSRLGRTSAASTPRLWESWTLGFNTLFGLLHTAIYLLTWAKHINSCYLMRIPRTILPSIHIRDYSSTIAWYLEWCPVPPFPSEQWALCCKGFHM